MTTDPTLRSAEAPGSGSDGTDTSRERPASEVELVEVVLTYRQDELDSWKRSGRRPCDFAEERALRHYEHEGWTGCFGYAFGCELSLAEAQREGLREVEAAIPQHKLEELRAERSRDTHPGRGPGKPDLFLHKGYGIFMFAEVKTGRDQLRERQLRCIAQILSILRCEVEIVCVREENQVYVPKRYAFDLEGRRGWRTA